MACGGGNSEASQAVGSDGDNIEPAPPQVVEQQPDPESAPPPVTELQPDPEPSPMQCKVDKPAGSEIVLLAGQSNANTGLIAALGRTLTARGTPNWPGNHRVDGNPIRQWISQDGTVGPAWSPMIRTLDLAIQRATNSGEPLNGLTFVWFQGESDVSPTDHLLYEARLRQLINAVQTHAKDNWTSVPEPAFAVAMPEYKDERVREGIESVRRAISTVANDSANVCAFDTRDINRYDLVHIPNYPGAGSPEQFKVAERALACGRIAANRCEWSETEK